MPCVYLAEESSSPPEEVRLAPFHNAVEDQAPSTVSADMARKRGRPRKGFELGKNRSYNQPADLSMAVLPSKRIRRSPRKLETYVGLDLTAAAAITTAADGKIQMQETCSFSLEDFQLNVCGGGGKSLSDPEITFRIHIDPETVINGDSSTAASQDSDDDENNHQFSVLMAALQDQPPAATSPHGGGQNQEEEEEEEQQLYKCDLASCDLLSRSPSELAAHQLETGHRGTLLLQVGPPPPPAVPGPPEAAENTACRPGRKHD